MIMSSPLIPSDRTKEHAGICDSGKRTCNLSDPIQFYVDALPQQIGFRADVQK